jgi:hypothetical protein
VRLQSDQITKEYDTVAQINIKIPAKTWTLLLDPSPDKFRISALRSDGWRHNRAPTDAVARTAHVPHRGVGRGSSSHEFPSRLTAFGFFRALPGDVHRQIFEAGPVTFRCLFYHQLQVHDVIEFIPLDCPDLVSFEYALPLTPFAHVLITSSSWR